MKTFNPLLIRSLLPIAFINLMVTVTPVFGGVETDLGSGSSTTLRGDPTAGGDHPHPKRHTIRPRRERSPHDDDPSGLPTFTRTFSWKGQQYTARFVGSDPAGPAKSTTVNVRIVPLRVDFGNGVVADAEHDRVDGLTPVETALASPMFRALPFACGGTAIGTTQCGDAYMRANFWSEVQSKPGYHVLLNPVVGTAQTLVVPADKAYVSPDNLWHGIDDSWLYAELVEMLARVGAAPDEVVLFLVGDEVGWYTNPQDIRHSINAAYHAAAPFPGLGSGPTQSFIVLGTYSATSPFFYEGAGPGVDDTSICHEILEWLNDPYITNNVSPWPIGYGATYDWLEVCDPPAALATHFSDCSFPVILDGQTHYLAEAVFFDWFTRRPESRSVNGWYSFANLVTNCAFDCSYDNARFAATAFDFPGAIRTLPYGINNRGDLVGSYRFSSGPTHGFLWVQGNYLTIDMPGASKTFPVGITERGLISGYFYDSVGAHGFLLKDGRFTKVDYATGYDTYLLKINDQGQVAGFCFAHDGTSPIYGFVFKNGQFTFFQAPPFAFDPSVTAINDEGTLAGQYDTGDPAASYSYVQSRAGFRRVDFPGAFATTLNDLNDRGDIVGSADHPFTVHSAFYRRGEEWLHLLYGGGYTELTGCNNHGDATGIYYDYVLRRYRGLLLNPIRQPN